ncbi:MAG TPA: DEAD/DEAH box helicase [Tissierellaceae bacterium]|nr:DEAD/DEAH box helicase [Tissierellaceae bacterium]
MVDFNKLRAKKTKSKVIDPIEIFRRLPKPAGINDLYTSQAEVLTTWFKNRTERDTILKLHTGGGKTLVGLLAAQSTLIETGEPVLYLVPTVQLVNQTVDKAREMGIRVVEYERGQPLNDEFINGTSIMIATYKALFNGRSKFGIRGSTKPQNVAAIILDDAHVAFSVVRDSFTLEISSENNRQLYEEVSSLFRRAFGEINKLGTFDDIQSGNEFAVLEVPYWAWNQNIDTVREILRNKVEDYGLVWPLLRDQLHLCHAFVSRTSFTITPIQPLVNLIPTFFDCSRRIYMSATIADDSDIIKTFDVESKFVENALTSRSLAGISERMILIPDLMPFKFDIKESISTILEWTASKNLGSVILVPSDNSAQDWIDVSDFAKGPIAVEKAIEDLLKRNSSGPIVFSNRYDGMDLYGNACRLLVMSGLPMGTSNYELFRASVLFSGSTINRIMAQRIEQGIGRGARGAGDYCVVILTGSDLSGWISKKSNFSLLTSATRAQLEIGAEISKEVDSLPSFAKIINRSFERDIEWVEYHAETLADLVHEEVASELEFEQAQVERKALNLWQDGYPAKAISRIERFLEDSTNIDKQTVGWMNQLAARIASDWGNDELADKYQRSAFANNRSLMRPKMLPPYRAIQVSNSQAESMASQLNEFGHRRGLIHKFEDIVSYLHNNSSANQFENSLCELAKLIGLEAERHDIGGEGPDVLWLLPNKVGLVIEAKSRKKDKNALTKMEHGQLLVAEEWFIENYPDYKCIRVSVHPSNNATKAAVAGASHALTYGKLSELVDETRIVLEQLCESQLSKSDLVVECERLLNSSNIRYDKIADNYLKAFKEIE